MSEIVGREGIVESLAAEALAGKTVLLYGPVGVGKTAILDEVARVAALAQRPRGRAAGTHALKDVTRALAEAYPEVGAREGSQRQLRARLRLAIEANPGLLVLDHLQCAGKALKGFLRSLEGTGLGVLIAADAEGPRDHERVREMRLAYRERPVPPLHGSHMARILDDRLARRPTPHTLGEEDRSLLLRIASGRPGVIEMLVERLGSPRCWRDGRLLGEILRSDVSMAIAEVYVSAVNSRTRAV